MRPLLALGLTLALVAVLPAAAVACPKTWRGPAFEVRVGALTKMRHSTVVVCDRRRGAERVVRRAWLRGPARSLGGREIADVDIGGRRVAWTESVVQGGLVRRVELRALVLRSRGRPARTRTRRVIARRAPGRDLGDSNVAISARGDVAWNMEPDRGIVLDPADGPPRTVVPEGYVRDIEDEATLVYQRDEERVLFHEFRPLPRYDFCASRSAYGLLVESASLRVMEAGYAPEPFDSPGYSVERVCIKATGEDPVVTITVETVSGSDGGTILAAGGDFVLLRSVNEHHNQGCEPQYVETRDVTGQRPGRRADIAVCDDMPKRDGGGYDGLPEPPTVVSPTGVPAWFVVRGNAMRLLSVDAAGKVMELDHGARGELDGLRSEGDAIGWTHRGEPRRAQP
jgi:hypothetical protein